MAGSAILDPVNKEHWVKIQRSDGGTAHLLRLFEEYANTLVQNLRKTYLKPFIIITDNMIVAMDVLDQAKIPRFQEMRCTPKSWSPPFSSQTRSPHQQRAKIGIYLQLDLYFPNLCIFSRTKPVCVYWNHSILVAGGGAWSSKGCELVFRNSTHISCQCNHMTSFAVLMDVSKRKHGDVLPLKVVTYITVSASLVALLITFLLLAILRRLRSNIHSIHKNLVAAIFLSELIFLTGINQTDSSFICTIVAILLHYSYMCTFAWMFVEGLHIYRMLTEMRNINHGHMRFYYAIGWGIPAVITGLAVGLDPQGYGNPDFCWLSVNDTLIWSITGPICIVVLGICTFFFHCVLNKDVRRNLKSVFTGKKAPADELSVTCPTLLTRSLNGDAYTEDGGLYRTTIGESTVSLESSVRSGKSHGSSYFACTLREKKHSVSSNGGKVGHDEKNFEFFTRVKQQKVRTQTLIQTVNYRWMTTATRLPPPTLTARMTPGAPRLNGTMKDHLSRALLKATQCPVTGNHTGRKSRPQSVKVKMWLVQRNCVWRQKSMLSFTRGIKSITMETCLRMKVHPVSQTATSYHEEVNKYTTVVAKSILKNKITYPPPLTDKNMKNRLREKLSDYNLPQIPSKSPSVGSNEEVRPGTETNSIIIKPPPLAPQPALNGGTGPVPAAEEEFDSDGRNETSI